MTDKLIPTEIEYTGAEAATIRRGARREGCTIPQFLRDATEAFYNARHLPNDFLNRGNRAKLGVIAR